MSPNTILTCFIAKPSEIKKQKAQAMEESKEQAKLAEDNSVEEQVLELVDNEDGEDEQEI